jgi:hypothetical protein
MSERSPNQDFLDELAAWLTAPEEKSSSENGHGEKKPPPKRSSYEPTDAEVLEKCRSSANSSKFVALYERGDTSLYDGDDSRADLGLLGMLAFYAQDERQLQRLFDGSRLAERDKWRRRPDYRERTIKAALSDLRETYYWNRYRYRYPYKESNGNDGSIESISFAERPEPEVLEEVWEGAIVRGWPALIFGGTGVTKSVTALALAQAIACPKTKVFLGRDVVTANTMYADLELSERVQGRRAYHIACGDGRDAPPAGLRYMTTYGIPRSERKDFLSLVLAECVKHSCEVVFVDSVGLAVNGNPGDFEVIIEFFDDVLEGFIAEGITPVLLDHQRRLQGGEKNQSLGAYGSVWKENLARAEAQLELVSRDREAHTVTTRFRPKKASFGELAEPFGILTTFSENAITLELVEVDGSERAKEQTLSAEERVIAALTAVGEDGAGPQELADMTELAVTTVKKELSALRKEPPRIVDTGESEAGSRARKVRLANVTVTTTIGSNGNGKDSSDPLYDSVADVFAAPPLLFAGQLEKYDEDPERHFKPVCEAVVAMMRDEGVGWEDVADEVREELEKRERGGSRAARPTTVINIKSGKPYDEYVGREIKRGKHNLEESDWANPFKVGRDGTLEEVLQKYERYLLEERPDLIARLHELRGRPLACWCAPEGRILTKGDPLCCHGQVLARLADELE